MRNIASTFAVLLMAGTASADVTVSIPLELGGTDSVTAQNYTCGDDQSFAVQYVNAGANALAILPVDGEQRIFVNVVSGSGARYASGAHVWWTKGDTATLQNEMSEGGDLECQVQDAPPSE
ncbi:MliC family protein [Primorskyibacter flagellatus]|uniref:Membrane-bound inhibitor of C-type lysozyme n=1 Tax=Primorskyibacter flagellatus TaxID=1387277 RepID=A0A1W2DDV0_9RHOB|nr:MliC family protein [Primorskyibacter flagellatus]SMC95660.1 Membrane-bound inhibitor of C-type lysozyme [Primorskyibacter flagellatus]